MLERTFKWEDGNWERETACQVSSSVFAYTFNTLIEVYWTAILHTLQAYPGYKMLWFMACMTSNLGKIINKTNNNKK